MKKSDFFEKLNRELENAVPPLSEGLKGEPIRARADAPEEPRRASSPRGGSPKRRRARLRGIVGTAAAAVLVCASVLGSVFGRTPVAPAERYACLYIDVNPSLALTLDENYRVKKAVSRNADGDTLLRDEAFAASLEGTSAEDAAVLVAERAAQTGYFRLSDAGAPEDFNQISVTLLSSQTAPADATERIESGLIEYFCEKGMYVYVRADAETSAGAEELVREYEARPAAWYDFAAAQADFEELKALAETTVYDYSAYLLTDALEKYDLLGEIAALNDKIVADPDNRGGDTFGNYWRVDDALNRNVSALCAETRPLLEKLYLLYGVDCRARGGREGAASYREFLQVSAYRGAVSEESLSLLRQLEKTGINEQTFGGIENLPLRLRYYQLISDQLFSDLAASILDGLAATADRLLENMSELVKKRTEELYARYSALFSLPRDPVTDDGYAAFLRRIGKA